MQIMCKKTQEELVYQSYNFPTVITRAVPDQGSGFRSLLGLPLPRAVSGSGEGSGGG